MDVVDIVNVSVTDIDIVIDIVELQVNTFEILIFMIQIGNDQTHYPFGSQGSGTTTHPHCSQAAGLAPRYYPCQHTWGCPVLVCPANFANSFPARL